MGRMAKKTEEGWAIYITVIEDENGEYPQITPFFDTPEDLAKYCADSQIVAWPFKNGTYGQWLTMIHKGKVPTCILFSDGTIKSGIEAIEEKV